MMIHPTAIVDLEARLEAGVKIGAYSVIGPGVEIGAETQIASHVVIQGPTRIGSANRIHSHACLGDSPQDLGFHNEPTRLEIGDRNVIREFATMHRGSVKGGGITRVGNDGFFMAYSHVAHDCRIGNRVILANGVNLGGHVMVEDQANLGGLAAVHQFVRIGCHAMVGGGSILVQDAPPYMLVCGNHARIHGLNRIGLERAAFPPATLRSLKQAYRTLYRKGLSLAEACAALREEALAKPEIAHLLAFLQESRRGIMR